MLKLKKVSNYFSNYVKLEDFIILGVVLAIFSTLSKQFSNILKNNDYKILISAVAVALAYATFFINYQKSLGRKEDERKIKMLIDGLFISSFFPIIALLFAGEDIGFGSWDKYITYFLVILIMTSIFLMSFCLVELWWYMVKNIFKK